jgi:DNA-binding beta-propeller fold protein YncE
VQLSTAYHGSDDPFEGDRLIAFGGLPTGALVKRATLTVTPTAATEQPPRMPFEEVFAFGPPRPDELGAADWGVTAATTNSSIEVDLHARRTLAAVGGANISGSALAVDVGGLFVELNARGAVKTPGDTAFPMGPTGALPGVTVPRFRLTGAAAAVPSVDTVAVRSAPTNVSVKLGTLGPFWTYVGELTAPQTTPDFAETLQAFLLQAEVENGTYVVPFGLHSDGIARLDLALELEFVRAQSVLPQGLAEATLPFDLSTFASTQTGALSVRLPSGARVVPGTTAARVRGAFDSTRIAAGAGTGDDAATAEATITAQRGAAQPVEPAADVAVTGFDLFLAPLSPTVRLNVALLGDSDGKPFGDPLLPAPLEIRLSREQSRAAKWTTVPLVEPFNVEAKKRYWLVLQALDGEASWQASAAAGGTVGLQISSDAGLSWSAATDAHVPGPLTALHRLRVSPATFTMPISIDVGSGPATQHVSLRRFEPLGRVDLTIDTPELAAAFESAATAAGPAACSTAEHMVNGEFDQWIGVGDDLRAGESIPLEGSARALALSNDGARAYAATVAAGTSETAPSRTLLEPVELACGEAAAPIVLDPGRLPFEPVLVALDSRAERAYVVADLDGEAWLLIADLSGGALVGEALPLDPFTGLALAPGGDRLFLLRDDNGSAVIVALDVRTAERLAREATGGVSAAVTPVATVPLQTGESVAGDLPTPFAAAAAGNETLLAFAADGHTTSARLCLVAAEHADQQTFVDIGRAPRALAATGDASRIVVACTGDNTLAVVSTDADTAAAKSIGLASAPVAVALSDDGRRAAVLSATDLAVYDLDARRRVATASTGASPSAVAGSPGLDVLFVAESEGSGLARYATPPVPLEWTLTSGSVEPRCFAGDLAALLGRPRFVVVGTREDATRPEPSAISQVVPVAGGCRYEFSFRALADQPDSVGEVLWRPGDCGLAHADRVPIIELERSASVRREASVPALLLHRAVLDAPAGAQQAEVRFTTPPGGVAAVGFVSLKGTDAAGVNSDLRQRQNGGALGWDSDPRGADVTVDPAGAAVRVANDGAGVGALVQKVPITAGGVLELELVGRCTAAGSAPGPQLEIRFLDATDAAVGDAATAPLTPQSFDHVTLAVEPPTGAVDAEVRLELPAGAVVELERITVRQEAAVDVPLVFRSEAPGELTVANAQVAFDVPEVAPPGLPRTGLCPPTRPGDDPGTEPKPACGCCGSHETGDEATAVVTASGRPAVLRRCANCGCRTVSVSGTPSPRAPVLSPSRPLANALGVGLPREPGAAAATLLDVVGIGPVRARKLARVGIATIDRLATADADVVAALLGGITPGGAAAMIADARRLGSG